MSSVLVLCFEWRHFIKRPFKILALLLFVVAGIYGLHNGADLYHKQQLEVDRLQHEAHTANAQLLADYEAGKQSPEGRSWIDLTNPYWALRYTNLYRFKAPSPAMVYSLGQAEQYGYYKRVTLFSSPYDADLSEELANPERLQTGTLDFAFVLLFLSPLLLLVLVYDLKSSETEQGMLPLVTVQHTATTRWLAMRTTFYALLTGLTLVTLMLYGAVLTPVLSETPVAFGNLVCYGLVYLGLWTLLYFVFLNQGKTVIGNTLVLTGLYVLLAFIIPAAVYQYVSLSKPANLMTALIDAGRDERQELYKAPDTLIQQELEALYPELVNTVLGQTHFENQKGVRRRAIIALANAHQKTAVLDVEASNASKNSLIKASFWYNPVAFFQNQLNIITQTHYNNYAQFRAEIQQLVDTQASTMVFDLWEDRKVDAAQFLNYLKAFEHELPNDGQDMKIPSEKVILD